MRAHSCKANSPATPVSSPATVGHTAHTAPRKATYWHYYGFSRGQMASCCACLAQPPPLFSPKSANTSKTATYTLAKPRCILAPLPATTPATNSASSPPTAKRLSAACLASFPTSAHSRKRTHCPPKPGMPPASAPASRKLRRHRRAVHTSHAQSHRPRRH